MRREPTDAERKMWWILRSLKPLGMHFRRQAPIGDYIVDFAWYSAKLVVEIDAVSMPKSGATMTSSVRLGSNRRVIALSDSGTMKS